jgi:uncharacterized OB-fold protein
MTTQSSPPVKPVPQPLNPELTRPFWEAARRHELVLPRCRQCGRYHFYPRELCPYCLSSNIEWVPASGRGYLYTYSIIHQPAHPAFAAEVPYAYAIVQLVEGVMMPSNIVDCPIPDGLRIDMPLVAVFDDISPEWTLVKFKPA